MISFSKMFERTLRLHSRSMLSYPEHHFSTRDFLAKVDPELKENNKEVPRTALDDLFAGEISLSNRTMAGGFSARGFTVNDVDLEGSVLLLPRSSYLWTPKNFDEVTPESLALFGLLEPKLEILLLGTGEHTRRPNASLAKHFKEMGIVVEQMTSVRGRCTEIVK